MESIYVWADLKSVPCVTYRFPITEMSVGVVFLYLENYKLVYMLSNCCYYLLYKRVTINSKTSQDILSSATTHHSSESVPYVDPEI